MSSMPKYKWIRVPTDLWMELVLEVYRERGGGGGGKRVWGVAGLVARVLRRYVDDRRSAEVRDASDQ